MYELSAEKLCMHRCSFCSLVHAEGRWITISHVFMLPMISTLRLLCVRPWRQVLSLHELPSALPSLGWLANPHKQLPPLPEDGVLPPTIDEGLRVRRRPSVCVIVTGLPH